MTRPFEGTFPDEVPLPAAKVPLPGETLQLTYRPSWGTSLTNSTVLQPEIPSPGDPQSMPRPPQGASPVISAFPAAKKTLPWSLPYTWPVLLTTHCRHLAEQQMMPHLPGDPYTPPSRQKTPQSTILACTKTQPEDQGNREKRCPNRKYWHAQDKYLVKWLRHLA